MSSDKIGLLPASLSTAAESGPSDSSLPDVDSSPAPAKPKPRRTPVRKPKVLAAIEPEATQLELMPEAPIPSLPEVPAAAVAEVPEVAATANAPPAAAAKPRRRSKPTTAPAATPAVAGSTLQADSALAESEDAQPIAPSTPIPAQPLPRLSLTPPKPAPAAEPEPESEPESATTVVMPTAATVVSAAPAPAPAATVPDVVAVPLANAAPTESSAAPASLHPITHRIHPVALGRKRDALQHLLALTPEQPTLIYTRTKHGADKIARVLERSGVKAAAIHGDKSQGARNRALAGFRSGELKALVITDIAARLLDCEELPLIISYDLPHIIEDYTLRVRRTGSAAVPGLALTLITQEESPQFRAVRDQLRYPLEVVELTGFEAAEPFDPEREPVLKPAVDIESGEVPAPTAAAAPAIDARREPKGRGRRDRRGRSGRGEARPGEAVVAPVVVGDDARPAPAESEELPEDAQPRLLNQVRGPRPVHNGRKPRPDRPARGDRQPRGDHQARGDRQPDYGPPLAPLPLDDDDDGPGYGNSLTAPPPSQLGAGGPGRRRGRRDPFATVVVDENRANIYDERQPDDYRDQWSVLGPDTNRPSWTYAEHQPQSLDAPPPRAPNPPGARRSGPGGGPRGPQSGPPRGAQRHGRPRRAEGR